MCARLSLAIALVALCGLATACSPPCGDDAFDCEEGSEFRVDESCELEGELRLTLGQGLQEFQALEPMEEFEVHNGLQGGQHIWVALQIEEPALDYPLVSLVLDAEVKDDDRCVDEPDCDPWVGVAHREVVIGPDLEITADGRVEQVALLLVLATWPENLERRVKLYAQDACGRENTIVHEMAGS